MFVQLSESHFVLVGNSATAAWKIILSIANKKPFFLPMLLVCLSMICSIPSAIHAQAELRGTWLTTTGPDQIASGFNTATIVAQLKSVGINTIYVESWKNGYTQFPSPALHARIGFDRVPSLGNRNLLNEVIIQVHRNGQIAIPWFEYGFASQFLGSGTPPALNPLSNWAAQNGWLLRDQNGNFTNSSNGFAWMNPAIPQVRQLLIEIVLDAIETHDLDGIQFDDRLAWPREFGWDATTAAIYLAETGQTLPSSLNNTAFRVWRQNKVTEFAQQLSAAVRAVRPDLQLSISPSVTGFSDTNFNAKWTDWVAQGLFDEYIPQVYRDNLSNFLTTLPSNVDAFKSAGGNLSQLVIGLRLNGTGADTPLSVLQQQIGAVRNAESGQLAGHSIFYGKGLIENSLAMTTFYGGQADQPFFAPGHRPDPLVASLSGGQWQVHVPTAGHYRAVAEVGGRWVEVLADYFSTGLTALTINNATKVELLVDRRPYVPVSPPANVIQANVVHNSWAGSGTGIDSGKSLAQEGLGPRSLQFENLINSTQGINGMAFVIQNLAVPSDLSLNDFEFQQSPQGAFDQQIHPPTSWSTSPLPSVAVQPGSPSVVSLQWADGLIMNRWLRVTLKANSTTGLSQPATFYLGHLLGETTGPINEAYTIQFTDISTIRAQLGSVVTVDSIVDIDKNGVVQFSDISAMRQHVGTTLSNLSIP